MKNKTATIWISGVTASGKTTLAKELYKKLNIISENNFTFFDGEDLRKRLKKNYGHSLSERFSLIEEYISFIKDENSKGKSVILSTVSHKKKMRELARSELDYFMEVNLICSPIECSKRDYKNIYNRITKNSDECLPGVTEPYEVSNDAELILNTEENSIQNCNKILLKKVKKFLEFED